MSHRTRALNARDTHTHTMHTLPREVISGNELSERYVDIVCRVLVSKFNWTQPLPRHPTQLDQQIRTAQFSATQSS